MRFLLDQGIPQSVAAHLKAQGFDTGYKPRRGSHYAENSLALFDRNGA